MDYTHFDAKLKELRSKTRLLFQDRPSPDPPSSGECRAPVDASLSLLQQKDYQILSLQQTVLRMQETINHLQQQLNQQLPTLPKVPRRRVVPSSQSKTSMRRVYTTQALKEAYPFGCSLFGEQLVKVYYRQFQNNTRMDIKNVDLRAMQVKRDRALGYWQNRYSIK